VIKKPHECGGHGHRGEGGDTIYREEYINSSSHPLIHQTSQEWICTLEKEIFK
jgi:hypothetical protein